MDAAPQAAGALVRLLEARHGGPVSLVGDAVSKGEGFDSAIHLVQLRGPALPAEWQQPLVLRVKGDADRLEEAAREAVVQGWLADHGYPVPRVLEVFAPGALVDLPAQVMERAPGVLMLERLTSAPWTALSEVGRLAALQARLHSLPVDGFPGGADLLERRLRLTRHTAEALDHDGLRAALARVAVLAGPLGDAPGVICHGDFHPLNVLVAGEDASVIDWTDAGIGDRHGDVARTAVLFQLAAIAAGNPVERVALRLLGPRLRGAYLRRYQRHAPLDPQRIALWTPVHLLHGWSQVVGLRAGAIGDRGPTDDRADRLPQGLADQLEARFERAMAAVGA